MRTLTVLLLSFAFALTATAAPGDLTPYLVKNINPESTPADSNPRSFLTLGGIAVFEVDKLNRHELWRTDGTASGTYRLTEIGFIEILGVTGGRCFFYDDYRWQLWVTDGTLPGTFSLGEIDYDWEGGATTQQGLLYFAASDELWRSDGTPGGTYEVSVALYGTDPHFLTSFRGRIYFASGYYGRDGLWRSDGTTQGTVLVHDVAAESLYAVGPRLVFLGTDAAHGQELWASDGTGAGTRRISDLVKGPRSPEFQQFKVVGKRLYFVATAQPAKGRELYVTDGTPQGTARLTSFSNPSPFSLGEPWEALGSRMFFNADDQTHGWELWSTDGTAAGTRMVLDICPGDCPSYSNYLFSHKGRLYYRATDRTHGYELWVTDGTAPGTRMVKDICPGICSSSPMALASPDGHPFFEASTGESSMLWTMDGTSEEIVPVKGVGANGPSGSADGKLVFSAFDPDHGTELWRSDGTAEGTHLLMDIADEDVGGANPRGLMTLGATTLFFADDADGSALFRSDGTETGTEAVMRGLSNRTYEWTASSNRAYFLIRAGESSWSLWTSDGTEAGTLRLTPDGVSCPGEMSAPVAKLGSRVFFSAGNPDQGTELWITDGTRAGTRLVADLLPGTASSSPHGFVVFQGKAWFMARSRLWKSDGTAAGTIALGPRLTDVHPWTTYNGRLWFTGSASGGWGLWTTDGTQTVRIVTLGEAISDPVYFGGRVWFLSDDRELWSSDGTVAGTRELPWPEPRFSLNRLVSDGSRLYLGVRRRENGYIHETWVSDGTAAGTRKIADIEILHPSAFLNGRLVFVSSISELCSTDGTEAGTHCLEPDSGPQSVDRMLLFGNRLLLFTGEGEMWQTDGTPAGTKLIRDLSPGEWYSSWEIVKAGPRLFFPAFDPDTGWELWAMRE